jgi:hypothetical protein
MNSSTQQPETVSLLPRAQRALLQLAAEPASLSHLPQAIEPQLSAETPSPSLSDRAQSHTRPRCAGRANDIGFEESTRELRAETSTSPLHRNKSVLVEEASSFAVSTHAGNGSIGRVNAVTGAPRRPQPLSVVMVEEQGWSEEDENESSQRANERNPPGSRGGLGTGASSPRGKVSLLTPTQPHATSALESNDRFTLGGYAPSVGSELEGNAAVYVAGAEGVGDEPASPHSRAAMGSAAGALDDRRPPRSATPRTTVEGDTVPRVLSASANQPVQWFAHFPYNSASPRVVSYVARPDVAQQ